MTYFTSPFQIFNSLAQAPLGSNVVVVSDTMYAEYKKREAQKEIDILESRAKSYRETAKLIQQEIDTIKTEAGLLPASEEAPAE